MRAIFFSMMLLTLLTLTFNCRDENKYKKEIIQLDSMNIALKNVNEQIQHIDTIVLQDKIKKIKNDLAQIDTLLPDTLNNKELAILLMEHRAAILAFQQYPVNARELKNTATETEKRISDLRNDLAKDIADEKQVNEFIGAEQMNTNSILKSFSTLSSFKDSVLKKIDPESEMIKGKITELEILKENKKKKKK